jgi:DUF2934 family protein
MSKFSNKGRQTTTVAGSADYRETGDADYEQIAALAYQLWQKRGCPMGSPEEDWFDAQNQLQQRTQPSRVAA